VKKELKNKWAMKEVMGVGDKPKTSIKGTKKMKKKQGEKNAKIKANCQVRISLKCSKEFMNTMHK
jgi:hypothetical protein